MRILSILLLLSATHSTPDSLNMIQPDLIMEYPLITENQVLFLKVNIPNYSEDDYETLNEINEYFEGHYLAILEAKLIDTSNFYHIMNETKTTIDQIKSIIDLFPDFTNISHPHTKHSSPCDITLNFDFNPIVQSLDLCKYNIEQSSIQISGKMTANTTIFNTTSDYLTSISILENVASRLIEIRSTIQTLLTSKQD